MKNFFEIQFLLNLPGIGPATLIKDYKPLLDNDASIDEIKAEVLKQKPDLSVSFGAAEIKAKSLYEHAKNAEDYKVITIYDNEFPKNLESLKSGTLCLYVKGNIDALRKENIAFIGTRKPSVRARNVEKAIVKRVIENTNRCIVSGLALGCDQISHEVAVELNHPTVAVLPCGFNNITPPQNKELAQQIIETGGCLVSAYAPDTSAEKYFFTARDKIIAELADALIVIQSDLSSGTMFTTNAAVKYEKPIGCNTSYGEDISYEGNEKIVNEDGGVSLANGKDLEQFIYSISDIPEANTQLAFEF